jgi:ABC-2 type transport system permease protein
MLRYLRLLGHFARTELQYELEYRVNLALELVQTLAVMITSVAAVLVLFNYTEVMNGWTLPQMLVLLGVYYLVQGVVSMVFEPSIEKLLEHVRLGTLDFTLLKPLDSQFLVSVRHLQLVQAAQAGLGLAVVGLGLAQIGTAPSPWHALAFVATLACGLVLMYALLLTLATLSFWFVRVDNILAIWWAFLDAGRFPVDVYPGWLRVTMSTVVPVGVAVTVPAQAIAGRLDGPGLLTTLAGTAAAGWFAGWFWRFGLKHYTGASA